MFQTCMEIYIEKENWTEYDMVYWVQLHLLDDWLILSIRGQKKEDWTTENTQTTINLN